MTYVSRWPRHARLGVLVASGLVAGCGGPEEPAEPGPGCFPTSTDDGGRYILFGDLHVHSTSSFDALVSNTPLLDGGGQRTADDLCSFARYCSQVDFWALTDHAEDLAPARWRRDVEAIRACNVRHGGYDDDAELISFPGWEWTQRDDSPTRNFGHRNVVLRSTCSDALPPRPIGAPASLADIDPGQVEVFVDLAAGVDPAGEEAYRAVSDRLEEIQTTPACDANTPTRDLPDDCREVARSPAGLYARLDAWGTDAYTTPHGMAWGVWHPALSGWPGQYALENFDPRFAPVVEIYSGHGNSEEYRSWRAAETVVEGVPAQCPEPTDDYTPCCHRAGELVAASSDACNADPASDACLDEVHAAEEAFLEAGRQGFDTVEDATPEDWLACGVCRDCYQPAHMYRAAGAAQLGLALSDGAAGEPEPWRYEFGLVGSTDSHRAGPGAGYKETRRLSDAFGPAKPDFDFLFEQAAEVLFTDHERAASFQFTGGLAAVHTRARSRDAVWEALQRREVYATSGARIELWFDWVGSGGRQPMGSEVKTDGVPTFEIRARGAPAQESGCPEWVHDALSSGEVSRLCFGECYNPTDERHRIETVEVIRIRRATPGAAAPGSGIEDPLTTIPCEYDSDDADATCRAQFTDPEPLTGPTSYYVRVLQEPTPQYNADGLRCETDADGNCIETTPCPKGYEGEDDDCMGTDRERAASSPIFVTPER